jgi:heterodisulfide reductase subunit C
MTRKPIQISELDRGFKIEVTALEPVCNVTACFSCGTCTAGCPIHAVYPDHDPRKIIRMVNLGMKEKALNGPYIWYCSECWLCEQHCPQNVKFSNVWNALKGLKAKQGYPLPLSINQDVCSGCGICVGLCPYEAIALQTKDGKPVAHLVETLCRGCGACAAACPSEAILVNLFDRERIFAQIENFMISP